MRHILIIVWLHLALGGITAKWTEASEQITLKLAQETRSDSSEIFWSSKGNFYITLEITDGATGLVTVNIWSYSELTMIRAIETSTTAADNSLE